MLPSIVLDKECPNKRAPDSSNTLMSKQTCTLVRVCESTKLWNDSSESREPVMRATKKMSNNDGKRAQVGL